MSFISNSIPFPCHFRVLFKFVGFLTAFSFLFLGQNSFAQNSLRLTAAGQALNCGDIDVAGTQMTLEAKVFSVSGASVNVISKHTAPANANYLLRMGSIELNTSSGFTTLASPIPVSPNQCYHIAATYDGATLRYFVNGCETTSKPWTGNLTQNNFQTCIGNQSVSMMEQFYGYIDEVRIWNVVRTQAQIEANMDVLPTPGLQAGLLAYYDFELGYNNVQGNAAFNGTPVGAVAMVINPSCPLTTALFAINTNYTDVACGVGGGSITISTTGGISPYDYSIDGVSFQANPIFTGLAAGIYTVTGRSANGCLRTATVTISDPGPIVITPVKTDVGCFGANDGTINLTIAGGSPPPYTIAWTPNTYNGTSLTGLPAGNYSVTVSDPAGCTQTANITITQPPTFTAAISGVQNISCFGANDGRATVTPTGGTSPFTYQWNNLETTAIAVGLQPGSRTVIVQDANNCIASPPAITILEPPALSGSIVVTQNAQCFGSADGEATLTITGGTSPYTNTWPNGNTTLTNTALPNGNGTVNITDANGCTATATYNVTQPPVVTVTASLNNDVSCNGGSDGSATVSPVGGVGGFTYAWNNSFSGAIPTNLPAGVATVFVADANGCTANTTVTISEPTAISATVTVDNPARCFGASNGQATANPLGGTAPYSYLWSSNETIQSAVQLPAGVISVTVTDSKGCPVIATGNMTQPPAMSVSVSSITNISCNGLTDGSATANGIGGTTPYNFIWDNNESLQTAVSLAAGTGHYAGIIDQNGCTQISPTFTITEPTIIQVSLLSQTDITCFGANDGTASVNVIGGTSPYTYLWPNAQTTSAATALSPGLQTLTVTDNNLCTQTFDFTIIEPAVLTFSATWVSDITCFGANDGQATSTPLGGTPPYSYLWSNAETTQNASALLPGANTVTVTDANACVTATPASVNIVEPVVLTATVAIVNNVSCFGLSDGSATATPGGGTAPFSFLWDNGEITQTATALVAGTPNVLITDANGCFITQSVTITEPALITFTTTGTTTICIGQTTPLSAIPDVGQPTLTFNWDNAFVGASQNVSPVTTTSYVVSATDGTCNSTSQTLTVTVNPPLTLNAYGDTSFCVGAYATIGAAGSGGDGNLTFNWDNGLLATVGPHSVLTAATTTYTVTLTDACGTPPESESVTITVNPYPSISFEHNTLDSCSPHTVTFRNTSTIAPQENINYLWNLGGYTSNEPSPSFPFEIAGSYDLMLTATSAFGCADTLIDSNFVTIHPNPTAIFTPDPAITDQFNTQIYMVNNSVGASTYNWSFVDSVYTGQNPVINVPDTGVNYIYMEAVSEFGCIDTTVGNVYIEPMFAFYVPNAFSVNQDYVNETFSPRGTGFIEYEMRINSRWGEEVYRTKDIEKGWNGKLDGTGEDVKQDIYTYNITLTLYNGRPKYYKGRVSLLR